MLIGYARVSKDEQNLDLQTDALNAAGVEKTFTDKLSGAKADRKGLADALSHLRKGDVLVVWKLDRLGRGTLQLMILLNELHERGIDFRSLTEGIDTTTSFGRFYFTMAAALAQLERDRLIERTRAGLAAAKARGRTGVGNRNSRWIRSSWRGACWKVASRRGTWRRRSAWDGRRCTGRSARGLEMV